MEKLLKPSEVAEIVRVTTTAVVSWYNQGKFPNAFKIGAVIRIPLSDVEALKQKPEQKEAG